MLDVEGYLSTWSGLHGGVAPSGLVGGWLRTIHALARPLAVRRVPPGAVTLAGLGVALAALPAAAGGGRWPLLALVLVVVSGAFDSVDGAVAVLSDRITPAGAVLDSICDRLADLGFIAALWLAGAPAGWCFAGAVLALVHEQLRASAKINGMAGVGVLTVSERPTRVIVTAAFLLGVGLFPAAGSPWATGGAITWTVLGVIGFGQLALAVRRRLR